MTLSDTQSLILSAASQHQSGLALPLPKSLKGGAAQKVITALVTKGLLEEVEPGKGEPIWRETGDGHGVTLAITAAGLAAIGVEAPAPARTKAASKQKAKATKSKPAAKAAAPAGAPAQREGTKQATMIEMLRRKGGATVDEIVSATGWQKHTVRGAMAGALKKRLGLNILATVEDRGRVYRIA